MKNGDVLWLKSPTGSQLHAVTAFVIGRVCVAACGLRPRGGWQTARGTLITTKCQKCLEALVR